MQPIIELKSIQYMLAIEREGGIQKAAEALYISQPALSQYIKRLEQSLGYPLYYRNKGKSYLTESGKIALRRGEEIMHLYDTMMEEMEVAVGIKDVHLGWPTAYSTKYYGLLLADLEENKYSTLQVSEDSVENLITRLLSRELDVIFIPALYSHPLLNYCTINHEEFLVAIPKNHEANRIAKENQIDGAIDLHCLRNMPFIGIEAKAAQDFFDSLFRDVRDKIRYYVRCDSWDCGFMIASQGASLILLPSWYRDFHHVSDQLDYYRIRSTHRNYRVFAAVTRSGSAIAPDVQHVIDSMIHLFGDEHAGQPVPDDYLITPFHY